MENIKERFKFNYESSAAASFLVLVPAENEKLVNYQIEMIASNPSPGILPLDVRQKDGILKLYYNVTSMQSLSQLLKRKKLMRDEFIRILKSMSAVILGCKNLLLSDKQFLIDENYIFINPSTLEVAMVYLPVTADTDILVELRNFIIKLIIQLANFDESENDNFLQRIIGYVKTETFNLNELKKLLNELEHGYHEKSKVAGKHGDFYEAAPKSLLDVKGPERKNSLSEAVPLINSEAASLIKKSEARMRGYKDRAVPPSAIKYDKDAKQVMPLIPKRNKLVGTDKIACSKAKVYRTSSVLTAVFSQLLIIALIAAFWNTLKTMGDSVVTTCAGIFIAVLGVDYFLFKYLFNKVNMDQTPADDKHEDYSASESHKTPPNIMNHNGVRSTPQTHKIATPFSIVEEVGQVTEQSQKESLNSCKRVSVEEVHKPFIGGRIDETTYLSSPLPKKTPYLQGKKGGRLEEIPITKDNFIIGRIKEQVDFVTSNNAVGKIHAEIIKHNECYYIKDLNSRNGTYINDIRLDSNKECEIKNNDRVTFANSSYTFVVPQ